jgi:hypothetical protein
LDRAVGGKIAKALIDADCSPKVGKCLLIQIDLVLDWRLQMGLPRFQNTGGWKHDLAINHCAPG